MKAQITASSAIVAAVMLAACASKGPVSATRTVVADVTAPDKTSSEYQSLVDNASKQLVCRRQAVTGSRIGSEVCLTRAQMAAQRERAQEMMRDIKASAAIPQPIPDRPPPSMPRSTP
jgi:hypothetical protein